MSAPKSVRNKAQTVSDKLADFVIDHGDLFDGQERDDIGGVIQALTEIAEGGR